MTCRLSGYGQLSSPPTSPNKSPSFVNSHNVKGWCTVAVYMKWKSNSHKTLRKGRARLHEPKYEKKYGNTYDKNQMTPTVQGIVKMRLWKVGNCGNDFDYTQRTEENNNNNNKNLKKRKEEHSITTSPFQLLLSLDLDWLLHSLLATVAHRASFLYTLPFFMCTQWEKELSACESNLTGTVDEKVLLFFLFRVAPVTW